MRIQQVRNVDEVRSAGAPSGVPLHVHPGWRDRFPWLVQGVTGRGDGERSFDLACFGLGGGDAVWRRWREVAGSLGMPRVVQGRQVHGATVRLHRAGPPGIHLAPDVDGHLTTDPGVLLTVTVADCVPVFLVAPRRRAAGLLHAGWRGVAAGVLRTGVEAFRDRLGVPSSDLRMHAGPAICGDCYEVGVEVHRALGRPDPGGAAPVDLRAILVERALELGVPAEGISTSSLCTRCGDGTFYSHRGGDRERQAALLGLRTPQAAAIGPPESPRGSG